MVSTKTTTKGTGKGFSHHHFRSPKPKGDKAEFSPNSRAKCTKCKQIIQKGTKRVGKEEYFSPRSKYIFRYYHESCLSDRQKASLQLPASAASPNISAKANLQAEFDRQSSQADKNRNTLKQRDGLRQQLRLLRTLLSNRLRCEAYQIFHNSTLDDLVLKLPKTLHQLRDVSGIGPKKIQYFGTPIVTIVKQYSKHYKTNESTCSSIAAAASMMAVASPTNPAMTSSLSTRQQNELRGRLRQLRSNLAAQHSADYPLYLIYTNKTLDDIVLKVPTTQAQLLKVNGIGQRKAEQFGTEILGICREYNNTDSICGGSPNVKNEFHHSTNSESRRSWNVASARDEGLCAAASARNFAGGGTAPGVALLDSNDDNGDLVQVTETLSAEEIVNMAFENAVRNGYVISIDDDNDVSDDGFV